MSGGNCPETPRQKMISMMYLFLTAMLAVNVSSTVLNGFTLVDESLRSNNEIFKENNNELYSKIKFERDKNETKFGAVYDQSIEIHKRADELFALIDSAKWRLAVVTDGEGANPYDLKAKDNVDAGFEALVFKMVGNKNPSRAEIIKQELNDYRDFLLNEIIQDTVTFSGLSHSIMKSLDTSDPVYEKTAEGKKDPHEEKNLKWEEVMFTGVPVGAVMALMSKLQTDIRNTESMALTHLMSQATASDFKVNDIKAHIIPSSSYLVKGSTLNATALLAATDSTKRPGYEVFIDGNPVDVDQHGAFEYATSQTGIFEITGNIVTEDENGNPNYHAFEPKNFEVVEPFATVSATRMNVLYAGVENPMSISVPGFSAKDIKPSLSDGSPLIPNGSGYIAKPKTPGKDVNVVVNAMIGGELTTVGKYLFRVKSLPPPTAFVQYPKETKDANGNTVIVKEDFPSGRLKKKDLLDAYGIVAKLQDSDFEVSYRITGFDMTFYDAMGNASTARSTNSKFTDEQKNKIKSLARGKQFFISNVRAIGPDGLSKRLPPIDITLN